MRDGVKGGFGPRSLSGGGEGFGVWDTLARNNGKPKPAETAGFFLARFSR